MAAAPGLIASLAVALGLLASAGAAHSGSPADEATPSVHALEGQLEAERRYNEAWGVSPDACV